METESHDSAEESSFTTNHIHESDRNGNVEDASNNCSTITPDGTTGKHHSSKHHSSDKHRSHKSSSSSEKHRSSHSDKHKSSSSSDKHRSSSSGDKHKSSSSSGDKHKSSSSSGDKHKSSSSSGDKHKSSSSSGDKHKSSSSSGDKHKSSSSSGDKHKSSSSSGDKHRSGGSSGDKHRSGKHKSDKHRSSSGHDKLHSVKSEGAENSSDDVDASTVAGIDPVKYEPMSPADTKLEQYTTVDVTRGSVEELMNSSNDFSAVKQERLSDDDDEPDVALEDRSMEESIEETPGKRKCSEESDGNYGAVEVNRKKIKTEKKEKKRKSVVKEEYSDDEYSEEEPKKKKKKTAGKATKPVKNTATKAVPTTESPQKGRKAKKVEESLTDVWRWWEEEKKDNSIKWKFLEHKGPVFAVDYEPLPPHIKFYYNGKEMKLEAETEEVGTFYGKMLDHDYTTKEAFNQNFFKDWRKVMSLKEKEVITDLQRCNFSEINEYFKLRSEERKNRSKEEKAAEKKKNEEMIKEYGTAIIDGYRQKIGNFRIEPPSLFRGRGEHPKMGCLKKRLWPKDVIINCSKDSVIPAPPYGMKWKEVRHDNTVTWLASWTENVQGQTKYVMLNASSRLKGEKDWQKYEMARKLHKCVDKIRASYREDMSSKEMRIRQRAVAMYFIDKLALRAGNEKDEETADTVGCCTLRVEHLRLHDELGGKENVVEFDFLGKDSMRYQNQVAVDKRAYKNLRLFMKNKQPGDDLFDRLNTTILNKHLTDLMEGLTAKVFRTYNASKTLQDQLELLTNEDDQLPSKLLSYNRANRAVAVLCNHQRSVPKSFSTQMENLQNKIAQKRATIKDAKKEVKQAKSDVKNCNTVKSKDTLEKKKKAMSRLEEQLTKLEVSATDKDENKDIALGTSKLNYLDPRISVAWCRKFEVPVDKVYNKTQREKFQWAIDMATAEFYF